jgi:hypothetical protein
MKVGGYSIPQYRLTTLLSDTKKIYEQFKSDEVGTEFIAHTLGQAPRGGAFLQRMADLRSYGLIEGRGSKIRVTELGKQATYGHEVERVDALVKLVKNIPLWAILNEKFGSSIKEENFWIDLMKITGAERVDAQKQANSVRNAYIADIKDIILVEKPKLTPEPQIGETRTKGGIDKDDDMEITSKEAVAYIKFPGIGAVNLDLNDETNLSLAEQILKTVRTKLQKRKEMESPSIVQEDDTINETEH